MDRVLGPLFATVALAAPLLVGCVTLPGTPAPDVGISNGTTLTVTLVVNGRAIETVGPHSDDAVSARELPPLPWVVEARSPSSRLLTSMVVHQGDVWMTSNVSKGVGSRVDLSCGRLDIWSGPPLIGPMPGPGLPGDCLP